jgi:hypothetical protein
MIKTFTGKAMDIKGGFAFNNTEVCQWYCHGGSNQAWAIIALTPTLNYP